MNNITRSLVIAGLVTSPFIASNALAEDSPHSFTGKVALFSEYEYRGITQTSEKPAVQLNLDYANTNGFYLGTFLSNIQWLKDAAKAGGFSTSASLEWDIYGGFKTEIVKDVTLDVGYLRYEYPSSAAFKPKPNTDEIYAGVTYGPLNVKYSYSINDTFGTAKSKGTDFIELNLSQEIAPKLVANAQVAKQSYKGSVPGFKNSALTYSVYKVGLTYDMGDGLALGGYWKGTDADKNLYTYLGKDWGKSRIVVSVAKSF
jgi:uncharacterized protein (TIGR02001 family)